MAFCTKEGCWKAHSESGGCMEGTCPFRAENVQPKGQPLPVFGIDDYGDGTDAFEDYPRHPKINQGNTWGHE